MSNFLDNFSLGASIGCLFFIVPSLLFGQGKPLSEPPGFENNRADEDYSYLKKHMDNPYKDGFLDVLKYIALNDRRSIYMTLGGEYRPRYQHFSNINYTDRNKDSYLQRLSLHTRLNFGDGIRIYGELLHGYSSSGEEFPQSDIVDLHQAFLELVFSLNNQNSLEFRLGRQELKLGSSRLVENRAGTNIKRSFDLIKAYYAIGKMKWISFYGKEVNVRFNAFDNEPNFFNNNDNSPEIWALGTQFPIKKSKDKYEFYYVGFRSKNAAFNDVSGEEIRHSVGFRRYGFIGSSFTYNNEVIYQFGDLDANTISAFNIELDLKYKAEEIIWKPQFGTK